MAQKKRLGKDPFSVAVPAAEPEVVASPAKKAEVKTTPTRKPRSTAKTASDVVTNSQPVAEAPAEARIARERRDAEIEDIKRELALLQAMVMRLQRQMDAMNPWNERFMSVWQWWFSLYS